MRRADYLLALGVALLALVLAAARLLPRGRVDCAVLTVDGRCEATLPLSEAGEFTWRNGDSFLTVRVEDGRARILVSSCPDQTCVRMGAISRGGETAVCLPNRAVLSLTLENQSETDAVLQ